MAPWRWKASSFISCVGAVLLLPFSSYHEYSLSLPWHAAALPESSLLLPAMTPHISPTYGHQPPCTRIMDVTNHRAPGSRMWPTTMHQDHGCDQPLCTSTMDAHLQQSSAPSPFIPAMVMSKVPATAWLAGRCWGCGLPAQPLFKGGRSPHPNGHGPVFAGSSLAASCSFPAALPGESVPAHIHTYIHYDILF